VNWTRKITVINDCLEERIALFEEQRKSFGNAQSKNSKLSQNQLAIITLCVIMPIVIINFADKETERFYITGMSKRFPATLFKVAVRKLDYLNRAKTLQDLQASPGNHLEALKGDRKGKPSIRINDQYRIVFLFRDGDAADVEITDYH
jgi:proteic killer suppression protein